MLVKFNFCVLSTLLNLTVCVIKFRLLRHCIRYECHYLTSKPDGCHMSQGRTTVLKTALFLPFYAFYKRSKAKIKNLKRWSKIPNYNLPPKSRLSDSILSRIYTNCLCAILYRYISTTISKFCQI